jgi:succinyl-CoA synthetase beta subunit
MRLIEADGKKLLERRGLAVPRGRLYGPDETVEAAAGGAAIKAQLLAGARGKSGLVQLANAAEIGTIAASIAERMRAVGLPPHILVEEKVAVETECYLAWRIDDVRQAPVMLFSTRGGVEIETHADGLLEFVWNPLQSLHPHHLLRFLLDAGASRRVLGTVARFATELYRLLVAEDAELVEINPLAITAIGQVIALDAKVVLDDNARFRHRDWPELLSARLERAAMTPLERRAADNGLTLVELDGCVALFAGGAGFGMALVDLLADAGLPAANFADASGGASPAAFAAMGEIILQRAARPDVKAVVCFQVMGATSLKIAVDGLLGALDRAPLGKPLVVGFAVGATSEREMTAAEARDLFRARGHHVISDLDELIPTLRRIIQTPAP